MPHADKPRPPLLDEGYGLPRAILYMLLSAACFAVMGAMVKAAGDLPVHQKVFFRNLVTLVITALMAWQKRENPFGPTRHLGLLLTRSLAGLFGVVLYFYAIGRLTLAYHRAPAGRVSIWSYNNVLFSLILGLAVWGEAPAALSILGGAIIVTAAIMNHRAR
jgi:drug/metabolite transporter (DMT)-like permease